MRSIRKQEAPRELLQWKDDHKLIPENLVYNQPGFPHGKVLASLLKEQHYLCAYTMKSLASSGAHIEHFLPQSKPKYSAEAIDYNNMLACFPPPNAKVHCAYGAQTKADFDPEGTLLLSPLTASVERQFSFYEDGSVEGLTEAGCLTVKTLKLDSPILEKDRHAVIKGRLYPKSNKSISAKAARRLAQEINQPDDQGCLPEYCVAIGQAASRYASKAEALASRLKKKTK